MPSGPPTRDADLAPSRVAVTDALVDLYVTWRERAYAVSARYEAWARARDAVRRSAAFADYLDALEDEARAARRFGEFVGYAGTVLA